MRQVARSRVGVRAAIFVGVGLTLTVSPTARSAPPAAPAGEGAARAPLARYFPREDLIAYAEFEGLDAHAEAWRKTAAYRLLSETTAGAMFEDLITGLAGRALSGPGEQVSFAEFRAVVVHAARSGFAAGVVRKPDGADGGCVGVVLRGAGRGKVREVIEKAVAAGRRSDAKPGPVDRPGGRKLVVEDEASPKDGLAWWREGDDLAISVASPAGADLMIDALDGRRPDATGHPARAELARVENGFTPVVLAFAEPAALKDLPPQFAAYGFGQVKRLDYRWGFQGEAVMTVTRLNAPAPRPGLLALFDQPTFDRKALAALPPGLTGFTAFSVDPADLYDRIAAGFAGSGPQPRAGFERFEKAVRDATGQRLRDDLLVHLGPKVIVYRLPGKVDAPANALAGLLQGLFMTPGLAVVVDVKDEGAFSKAFDGAMANLGEHFKAAAEADSRPPDVRVNRLKGVEHGYALSISPTAVPVPAGCKPTLILGRTGLVIASTPDAARAAGAGAGAPHGGDGRLPDPGGLAGSLARLPDGMILAHVSDARRSLLPELIANLPGLIHWYGASAGRGLTPIFGPRGRRAARRVGAFGLEVDPDRVPAPGDLRPFLFPSEFTLTADDRGVSFTSREAFPAFNPAALAPAAVVALLPAAQSARAAAGQAQSVNNLKQIGLALHNYHNVNNHFPPAAIRDKNGKPLLSWRVAILPYVEQAELYNEFKLDEPWDSEHNKPLLARMPACLALPGARAEPGSTFYRGFSGTSALFDPQAGQGVGLADVTDGTSNTLAVVEARKAVPWTKPDEEIPFDPVVVQGPRLNALVQDLGGHFQGGFNALMLDGSVRFIKMTINPQVLRAIITRNQGEVVSADSF